MSLPEQLNRLVQSATGPAPWFWETFPMARGATGHRYRWRFHGQEEGLNFLVTLHGEDEGGRPRLALNAYCRPFTITPGLLGIWYPDERRLHFECYEPDWLQTFSFDEITGWFAGSNEKLYTTTPPMAEFVIDTELAAGVYEIQVPDCFRGIDEMLVPCARKAKGNHDPTAAIYAIYPQGGLVEVLPQNWLTRESCDAQSHWITRVTRDPETYRIVGELARAGGFELTDSGRDFCRWL